MPIAWFIAPYQRDLTDPTPARYCTMLDATSALGPDDDWAEAEILHTAIPTVGGTAGKAIVRIRAPTTTLADLATVYRRLPKSNLDDLLSDLSNAAKKKVRDEFEDSGYTLQEIQGWFGNNIGDFTLRQVLTKLASRRQKPRYDAANNRIVCDGMIQTCRDIADVEQRCFSDTRWTELKNIRDALLAEWDANQRLIWISKHLLTASLPKWEWQAILILCRQAGYYFDKIRPNTFPTTSVVLDDFNRTNAINTPGANWSLTGKESTALDIVSSTVYASDGNSGGYYAPSTYGVDQEAWMDIATAQTTGARAFLALRLADFGSTTVDGYGVSCQKDVGTDVWRAVRWDNGTSTFLSPNGATEYASGDKIGGDDIGSTLSSYLYTGGAWSLVNAWTDTTYAPVSSNIGTVIYTDAFRGDNFGGGTVINNDALFSRLSKKHLAWPGYRM